MNGIQQALHEWVNQWDFALLLEKMLHSLGMIFLGWLFFVVSRKIVNRWEQKLEEDKEREEKNKRVATIIRLVRQAINVVIWIIFGLMILKEFGLDIGPLLASAGVVGLAVGFGAQNLIRDFISGLFLMIENQVRVGDVIKVRGVAGLVEKMTLRTIVLRDLQGTIHVIPNGAIDSVSNLSFGWAAYVFEIGVSYHEDVDRVIDILKEVGEELKNDEAFGVKILEAVEVFGLDQLADSALIIKGRIKTKPLMQWEVGREFLRRVKKRFDQEKVEIPFPQRTVSLDSDLLELFKDYPQK